MLVDKLNSIVSKLNALEISNYDSRFNTYLDEDKFINYINSLLLDKTAWSLAGNKYNRHIKYIGIDGSSISICGNGGYYKSSSRYKNLTILVKIVESGEEVDLDPVDIFYSWKKRKLFRKLLRSFKEVEGYLLDLSAGQRRFSIKKFFSQTK